MASKKPHFDALFIGSTFASLRQCHKENLRGKKVLLFEEQEAVGHTLKPLKRSEDLFPSCVFRFSRELFNESHLQSLFDFTSDLQWNESPSTTMTFQNGKSLPFMGFAGANIEAQEVYTDLTSHQSQWIPNQTPVQILKQLEETLMEQVQLSSQVTRIAVQDDETVLVEVNGDKCYTADRVYLGIPAARALKLLDPSGHKITKANWQKLGKVENWSAIRLVYQHTQEFSSGESNQLLYGAKNSPCFGEFAESLSVWTTYIEKHEAQDNELLGSTLREMKKQIKRWSGSFFETVANESVLFHPLCEGSTTPLLQRQLMVEKEPRLLFLNREMSPYFGWNAELDVCLQLENSEAALTNEQTTEITQ